MYQNLNLQARQINPLADPDAYYREAPAFMSLKALADAGGTVTRVRWLKEGGRMDLSYVHGTLPDGTRVHVQDAPALYLRPQWTLKRDLIAWAQEAGVYAKGLGLIDQANWSVAW